MLTQQLIQSIRAIPGLSVQEKVPMRDYTSFKIGGPADILAEPTTKEALSQLLALCKRESLPLTVIGAGSNLLVSDSGIDGVVCRLAGEFDQIEITDTEMTAGAAVPLAKLARAAQRNGLSGLEFASGIPGTLGGAVFMNAGAYGGEMKDVVAETEYMDTDGKLHTVKGEAHGFAYRHSMFSNTPLLILSSKIRLVPKDSDAILETMRELNGRRKEKQPLDKPSAGSTFKRPEGYFAAKLIEDAGLKGVSVGDACVSEKHAGFIVNNGSASCKDVCNLIAHVQETVLQQFGVSLETEVKIIGR